MTPNKWRWLLWIAVLVVWSIGLLVPIPTVLTGITARLMRLASERGSENGEGGIRTRGEV